MFQLDSNSKELFSIPITHCSSYLKHPKTGCGNVHISTITKPASYERPTVSVLTKKKKKKMDKPIFNSICYQQLLRMFRPTLSRIRVCQGFLIQRQSIKNCIFWLIWNFTFITKNLEMNITLAGVFVNRNNFLTFALLDTRTSRSVLWI